MAPQILSSQSQSLECYSEAVPVAKVSHPGSRSFWNPRTGAFQPQQLADESPWFLPRIELFRKKILRCPKSISGQLRMLKTAETN